MSERTVTVRLRALISDYQKAMQTAAGDSKKFASVVKGNFTQLNQDVGKLGETMTRRVSVPLAGLGVGATKLASDFETTFAQMVGLAGVSADEIDGLRESVLKLGHETARGPTELAQALYFIRSSGIDAAHAMGVLEVAAKASAAGLGSTVVVADAVTSAMNAYGAANLSAQQATDILVAAVREGKTEAAALAPQLGILIPTAAAMGISFAQVAGVMAVMSRTGLDAAEASTSLNAIFSTLLGTSKEGVAALEEHGLSLKSLRDTAAGPGGLVAVMRILDGAFKDNDEALSVIIPNVRAFRGVMNVLAQDAGSVDTVMRNVANSTGATDDAFKAVKTKWAFELKQAVVDLQIALIKLGELAGPMFATLGRGAAGAADAFSKLPHWLQQVVVSLGLIAVAAGPAMKVFSVLAGPAVGAIKVVIAQLVAMRAAIIANQVAGMSYGQALVAALTPVGVAVGAIAVIAIGATAIWQKYANEKRIAARDTRDFVAALKEERDAVGTEQAPDAPKPRVIEANKKLFAGDLGAELRNAGADMTFFTNTVLTGSDALKGFANAADPKVAGILMTHLKDAAKGGDELAQQLLALQTAAGLSDADMARLVLRLNGLQKAFAGARQEDENEAYALTQSGVAATKHADAVGDGVDAEVAAANAAAAHAAELANETAAADAAEKELRALLGTLNALYGGAFDVADAQQAFRDSLTDVDTAAKAASGGGSGVRDLTSQQRQLEKATEGVTKAQEDLAKAEAALAKARQGPSAREKSDAGLGVREAQLGVKEAIRAQADARKRLLEERKKGREGDVAGAQLDLERSAISLKRAQDRLTDAQAEQNKVMHSGEETSDNVKGALDDLKAAQERVTDATQAQIDAEAQLRGESGGGPVADRARSIRGSYDQMVNSAKDWITKLIEQKRPTSEIIAALDEQSKSAQHLIDVYGDPDGKLARFIDANNRLRLIFTDQKFISNFTQVAAAIGGMLGVDIPNFFGSDSTGGRAKGGPVKPFTTYEMGEEGPEALTFGATRQPQSFDMAPPDKLGKGAAELSNRSAMGARTFMVGLDGPQFITMGAQGGWVTPNDKLGDIDGARAKGGPVLPGRTYLVGERGAEILTVGGFWQQRTADPTAGQSVTNYVTQRDSVTPGYGNGDAQTGGAATVAVSVADGPYRMTEQGPVMLVPTPGASGANTSSMYATATNSATTLSTATTYTVGLNGPEVITMGSLPGWVHSDVHLLEGRASGGPVAAGQTVVVGENGPEIITVGGQSTGRLPQRTASGPTPTGGRDTRSVAEIVAERTAKTAGLRRAAVERRAMNALARTAAAPGSSAIGASGGIEAANYQSGNEGLGVAAPSTVGPSVNESLRNSAMPWSGQLAAASSASAPGPIALEVNVAVQGDFVKVANELVRLSKQNGGLPIRIRSGN